MATIGLDRLYYAKITENDAGEETYGTPSQLAKATFANPAAGWCTDGGVCRGALAAKIRKVHTTRRKRLQNRHIWGKIKRTQKTDCLWRTRCLIPN